MSQIPMNWNHRVIHQRVKCLEEWEDQFSIHEVYYDEFGNPINHTIDAISPKGDSIEDLKWVLDKMQESLKHPILSYENFPDEFKLN